MLSIRRILFPTDLSESGRKPFPKAVALADWYDAELRILHVVKAEEEANGRFPLMRDQLKEWSTTVRSDQDTVPIDQIAIHQDRVGASSPTEGITQYVRNEGIDLVVMGTHGRRGVNRMVFGSVTEKVVRRAQCPVLTVREGSEVEPTQTVRRMVVPVDFSEASKMALRHAKEIALTYGAKLELVHVVEEMVHPSAYGVEPPGVPGNDILNRLERSLAEMVRKDIGYEHVRVKATVGHPPSAILDYVRNRNADLVVIATHGRTGLDRILIGSVAEPVIRRSPTPVFVVKPTHGSLLPSASTELGTVPN